MARLNSAPALGSSVNGKAVRKALGGVKDSIGDATSGSPDAPTINSILDVLRGLGLIQPLPPLITNGTFDTDASGWTAGGGATLGVDTQRLSVTNGAGQGYAYQAIATTPGKTYDFTLTGIGGTNYGAVAIGTTAGGQDLYAITVAIGAFTASFTATSTTTYVNLYNGGAAAGDVNYFDDVSVTPA